MASYFMNGDDISTDLHLSHSACLFSALEDALRVKRHQTKHWTTLPKFTGNREGQIRCVLQNALCISFHAVRTKCSLLCCRPSPGSHCHTSVECRSSALIDLGAHDPVSKVKGHFWCDFCCCSNKQQPKRERAPPRHRTTSARFMSTPQLLQTTLQGLKGFKWEWLNFRWLSAPVEHR